MTSSIFARGGMEELPITEPEINLMRAAIDTLAPKTPTNNLYQGLQAAYDFYNSTLFNNELPACLITVQRKSKAYGYYAPVRFQNNDEATEQFDEIALNPKGFNRTKEQILSTLVHEMVHLWQQHKGKPGKGAGHNKQWAEMMKTVGLHPSHTGEPGGKETGKQVSHYIIETGLFAYHTKSFLENNAAILYKDIWQDTEAKKKSVASKTKFTCPDCEANAWAKPESNIVCGDCNSVMLSDN